MGNKIDETFEFYTEQLEEFIRKGNTHMPLIDILKLLNQIKKEVKEKS